MVILISAAGPLLQRSWWMEFPDGKLQSGPYPLLVPSPAERPSQAHENVRLLSGFNLQYLSI
jgi:hypothetical protein